MCGDTGETIAHCSKGGCQLSICASPQLGQCLVTDDDDFKGPLQWTCPSHYQPGDRQFKYNVVDIRNTNEGRSLMDFVIITVSLCPEIPWMKAIEAVFKGIFKASPSLVCRNTIGLFSLTNGPAFNDLEALKGMVSR